jgi:lipopolysaccharide biosynthesis glycosyltransferase
MNIQAVTIGISENEENADWYGYAIWSSSYVKQYLGLDPKILTNKYLNYGVEGLSYFDKVTSLKLLLFDFFPKADRIIFYDCDWRPVRSFNICDYVPHDEGIYVVEDRFEICEPLRLQYGMKNRYFNTGFFIIDRKYSSLLKYCYDHYHSYNRMFVEQCVINQVCDEYVSYLDPRLNVKDLGVYPNSEVLAYHNGHNYGIYKEAYPDVNWYT